MSGFIKVKVALVQPNDFIKDSVLCGKEVYVPLHKMKEKKELLPNLNLRFKKCFLSGRGGGSLKLIT